MGIMGVDDWACEASLWTANWIHRGSLRAKTECGLVILKAEQFQLFAGQSPDTLGFVQLYARDFVKQLARCAASELTDLEDTDMDVEWIAQKNHVRSQAANESEAQRVTIFGVPAPAAPTKN